jgi:GNAT superfamily N-acetyltransferase
MNSLSLRGATMADAAFALQVTEACMRAYAEQTSGVWDGGGDLNLEHDKIVRLDRTDIGIIGVEPHGDHWFLEKLYLLPAYQNQGLGGSLLERLKNEAASAQIVLRLTVLEVNPARRFYERHGFVLARTIPPRHPMEWWPQKD